MGLKVEIGNVGPIGPTGPTGPSEGPTGPTGATGAQGSQGWAGSQGSQGAVGSTGPQGSQGSQGDIGNLGRTGPTGPQGSPGLDGATGPQGTSGIGNPITQTLLPDMTGVTGDVSLISIGSATAKFSDVYAHDVHVDAGSLYVNEKKVIEDTSPELIIKTDINQDLSVKTYGIGDINLVSDHAGVNIVAYGTHEVMADIMDISADVQITGSLLLNGSAITSGPTGPQGYQGTTGAQGSQGSVGSLGPTGPTGTGGGGLSPITGTAGETLSQYQVVYCNSSNGKYYKAQNSGTAAQASVVGIVTQSGGISQDGTGEITLLNTVTNGSWSWTAGSPLFLSSTAGSMTQTEPVSYGTYWVPLGYAISATQVWFQVGTGVLLESSSSNTVVVTNTQANRPAAGVQGRIFLPTDGYLESVDNGTSWKCRLPGGLHLDEVISSSELTSVNGGYTTLTDLGGRFKISQVGTGSSQQYYTSAYVKAVPVSTPWSLVVGIKLRTMMQVAHSMVGVCLTNGTSNPTLVVSQITFTGTGLSNFIYYCRGLSSPTAWGTDYTSSIFSSIPVSFTQPFFFRIYDNGTTRFFDISSDNRFWFNILSHGRTTYLTPTHAGISVSQAGSLSESSVVSESEIFYWYLG